jgi:4-diphosphocytidyl-2-C-methyl-D-erythritol kinase
LAKGIGDELTLLPCLVGIDVVLVKPDFPVSTRWVYENLDLNLVEKRPDTSKMIGAIEAMDVRLIARSMENVLESVTVKEYPELQTIMDRFTEYGALGSRMSGSGPTVFGLFYDSPSAEAAREKFLKDYTHVYHCRTIGRGDFNG